MPEFDTDNSNPNDPTTERVPPAKEPPQAEKPPVEEPATPVKARLDPTRYGDWELAGKCVDF